MYVTHERALIDHEQGRVVSEWPTLLAPGGELRFLLGKMMSRLNDLVRWSSQLSGKPISVSPMSGAWLRMQEAEDAKHGADV